MATGHAVDETFRWEPQPLAANFIKRILDDCCTQCTKLSEFKSKLHDLTGTRLIDWLDHLGLPEHDPRSEELSALGFVAIPTDGSIVTWHCEAGLFPAVRTGGDRYRVAIKVDSVDDFLAAGRRTFNETLPFHWPPLGQLRIVRAFEEDDLELCGVERHGFAGFKAPTASSEQLEAAQDHLAAFRVRQRKWFDPSEGFAHTQDLFAKAEADLGIGWAAELFFRTEREYWQSRNQAAHMQYARQQRLGLGWANHDHHTYRSSRSCFTQLIDTLQKMGFTCRERFYAGREAGWGAQVLEHTDCGVTIFADVDLSPDEVAGDFAHEPLADRNELGTVGLWCRLHGEAFLEAGLHHLECQFDFLAASEQLAADGVSTMAPFTDFDFLKQAFTAGEVWKVDAARVAQLLEQGLISAEQAERFRTEGALGSHLEILERNDGYKGFNQTGINDIILRTDPRR